MSSFLPSFLVPTLFPECRPAPFLTPVMIGKMFLRAHSTTQRSSQYRDLAGYSDLLWPDNTPPVFLVQMYLPDFISRGPLVSILVFYSWHNKV